MTIPTGILLPESVLYSDWFGIFAAFVAINTVIYVLLSVSKLFPVIHFGRKKQGFELRTETRSIYPDGVRPEDGPAIEQGGGSDPGSDPSSGQPV